MNKYHNYILNWQPSLPDYRDFKAQYPVEGTKFPDVVDLRTSPFMPPVWDQGQAGSCVSHGCAGVFEFDQRKQKETDFMPSRLFIYYNGRVIENTVNEDSGLQVRDGLKTLNQSGVCHETLWPYDISKLTDTPPPNCYTDAQTHKATKYASVTQDSNGLKQCLANGYPVVFGFTVYSSFMDIGSNGIMPMPKKNDSVEGGHCVICCGFDAKKGYWIIRNSWGVGFGAQGYFFMNHEYIHNTDLCSDFWVLNEIE